MSWPADNLHNVFLNLCIFTNNNYIPICTRQIKDAIIIIYLQELGKSIVTKDELKYIPSTSRLNVITIFPLIYFSIYKTYYYSPCPTKTNNYDCAHNIIRIVRTLVLFKNNKEW